MKVNLVRILISIYAISRTALAQDKAVFENYSFDFSGHRRPIAYESLGNTVELQSKVKLLPLVENAGGAYVLNADV